MSLRIFVSLTDTKKIMGVFDPEKNRFVITNIINDKEIAEALLQHTAEIPKRKLPAELRSIESTLASREFNTETAPWLSHVRIASNSVEGWDTREGTIALSIASLDKYDKFWEGSFTRLAMGTGPYLV